MNLRVVCVILVVVVLCAEVHCSALGRATLFTVDIQSEMAEFWRGLLTKLTEVYTKLEVTTPEAVTSPPPRLRENWKWN